jgi:FixJ family two-component response regulator
MRLGAIENAVQRGVERGLCAEQIATRLGISAEAVDLHRQALRVAQGAVLAVAPVLVRGGAR